MTSISVSCSDQPQDQQQQQHAHVSATSNQTEVCGECKGAPSFQLIEPERFYAEEPPPANLPDVERGVWRIPSELWDVGVC